MKKFLLVFLCLSYLGLFAQQDQEHEHDHEHGPHCGMPIAYQILEQKGKLQQQLEWYEKAIKNFQENKAHHMNRAMNVVYQVPCVVHIVWDNNNGTNITDAQVAIMMDNLNKDYARTNIDADQTRPMFEGVASSVDLQFCLANTDPDGNTTTGITRTETTHGQFDPQAGTGDDIKSTAAGGKDSWNTNNYMNIWVGDLTNGTGAGVVGYSTLPGSHGDPEDGFVMDVVAVANENLDRTPTHEIGHYFGLHHPWGQGNTGNCADDDGFADTPETDLDHLGGGCSDTYFQCGSEDQFENFMGYSNCTNMFTQEQAAFMVMNLEGTRASLLGNNLCATPNLIADFTPNTPTVTINAGQTVTFTDNSNGPNPITSWDWTFTGSATVNVTGEGPHVITYNIPGVYPVSLTVGDGNDTDTKTVAALVEVLDVLNANFSANITYAAIGENITFTDLTTGPDAIATWDWNFGNAATDNVQNPVYAYPAAGTYTVSLTVNDGTNNDTETKNAYIEVYDPLLLNIVDFLGVPTTINTGETVNFEVECNQTDNNIDSVRWIFEGADVPSQMYTNTNPFDVTYSTGGIFDVECRVYRSNGMDGDTLIKDDYIVVIAPDSVPVANFSANITNFPLGTPTTIDFTNLTNVVDRIDSVKWYFESPAGVFTLNDTDIHPAGIAYGEIGDFDVKLIVYTPFGIDSILKTDYIHVFDPANANPVTANFEAITVRLITEGESVRFEDLSTGDIQNWTYIIDRGAGASAIEYEYTQNPEHTFLTAGIYNVTLVVSNTSYSDTLTKERYVVVTTTPWPEPEGYCDTLHNIQNNEFMLTYRDAEYPSWGTFPGHYAKKTSPTSSEKKLKRYAEKFETYTPDAINAVLFPVVKAYSGDDEAIIRVMIWDADASGRPNNLLTGYADNKININTLQVGMFNYIELDEPIDVDSVFFVGFRLDYKTSTSPQDSFAVHMAPNRPNAEENTIYVSTLTSGGTWNTPTEFLEFELNSSMGIKVMGCVVNVSEIEELEATINVFPNPASDKLNIDLGQIFINDIKIEMYDIVGKKVNSELSEDQSNKYQLDLDNCSNGFYLVNITVNGFQITKKVLIQK